ncbi:MAG: FIST N-terminal domain-containing protein [Tepidisphaeraceae bacterium]|jgi:small ligand-binding sensory domain FIST
MEFLSAISDHDNALHAIDTLIGDIAVRLDGRPDVVFAFLTGPHTDNTLRVAERIQEQLEPQALVGCTAEGVLGLDREIERRPAISLLAARLPGVRAHAFYCGPDDWPDLIPDETSLRQLFTPDDDSRITLAFADPFTTPAIQLLNGIDQALPGLPIVGGMASSASEPGQNRLILDGSVFSDGLVGLTLSGPLDAQTVVSQGCRPIGNTYVITRGKDNVIEQLGGRPAMEVAQEVLVDLTPAEQKLLENGLFVGRVIDEYREKFGRGDFLVRGVMRVNRSNGAIAITDYVRTGQTVQFHVRDAITADEDMTGLLLPQRQRPPAGGLLFSCNGRGSRMFEQPSHDIATSQKVLPQTPVAGFFAAGEFGPVGGRNFIHGHTASFAFFRAL